MKNVQTAETCIIYVCIYNISVQLTMTDWGHMEVSWRSTRLMYVYVYGRFEKKENKKDHIFLDCVIIIVGIPLSK